jgi:hypothetical protein
MIRLTELAVGNSTGRADLARRNQMQALAKLERFFVANLYGD